MFRYVLNELSETFDNMYVKRDIVDDHKTGQGDSFHIPKSRTNIDKCSLVIKELLYEIIS